MRSPSSCRIPLQERNMLENGVSLTPVGGVIPRVLLSTLFVILVMALPIESVSASVWGPEQEVSGDAAAEPQIDVLIAVDGSTVHVVWRDYEDGDYDVYYRQFDGAAWQPELEISSDVGTEAQMWPAIAAENGSVHVVWIDTEDGDNDVYYRHFDGTIWQPEQEISTDVGAEFQWNPSVAAEGDHVYVAWGDAGDGDYDIYYRQFDGTTWQPELEISTDAGIEDQWMPSIAVDNGRVHISWIDDGDGDFDIYHRYFDGAVWQSEFEVSTDAGTEQQTSSTLTADGDAVHIVWLDAEDGDYDVYYRSHNGSSWQAEQEISTDAGIENQWYPSVAVSGNRSHVVWQDEGDGDGDIYYRFFDGMTWQPEIETSTDIFSENQRNPSLAVANCSVHIAWQDEGDGDWDIYYRGGIEDETPPESSPLPISPYWQTTSAFPVVWTAMDDCALANISLYYRHSTDNSSWSGWQEFDYLTISGTDTSGAFSFTSPLGSGHYEFLTIANDSCGNPETPASAEAFSGVDLDPPAGNITVNDGDPWTNTTSVTLTLSYSDGMSGVSRVRYSNDGVWDTEPWESPSATRMWTLETGDGMKAVYFQAMDNAGWLSDTFEDDIGLDTEPPTGSVTINDGDQWANSTSVSLTLTFADNISGVDAMRFGNDGVWDDEPWEAPTATKAWTLSPGDGNRTVFYQIRDNAGWESTNTDDITLDTEQPAGSITIDDDEEWATSYYVTLTLTYSDNLSGVSKVRYSDDGVWDDETWQNASTTKLWELLGPDGTNTVYYQVMDNAGHVSPTYWDDIELDAGPPGTTIVIPSAGSLDVEVGANVTIGFTEKMNTTSVEESFRLTAGGEEVEGTFTWLWNGSRMIFDPLEDLEYARTYDIRITNEATDPAGNGLWLGHHSWFTTEDPTPEGGLGQYWWAILLVVLAVIAAAFILLILRRRREEEIEEEPSEEE